MDLFYPTELPISSYIEDISELIRNHQTTIIAGDTGSGKTTQLPKVCLEILADSTGLIGCTQPRRIAATSVSERVKEELGPLAPLVGSKIRFSDQTTADTRIKFMTDGILLAETKQDPLLKKYDVIIVDEAHERSLNIDFLLGYLHDLLPKRPDLKLLITSATIDTQLFSGHFDNAPVLNIEGRTYPVELNYVPFDETEDNTTYLEHCLDVVSDVCENYPPGDILVFLPTERDIRTCCDILRGRTPDHVILPLFGRLQSHDQRRIFKNHHGNKIVVASNVAETSITVPGIHYIVDSGLARIASYNHRSRTTRLPVTRISQASCNQRSGRSGRIGPGTCFRLYSEDDFESRPEFSVPEIQRANLAEVILQMVVLKLGDPVNFPFLEPPKPAAIRDGYRVLRELGALNDQNRLTDYGRIMSRLPIDPVVSRIIIEAQQKHALTEIVIIAAALAIQDPRVRPAEKEQLADRAHKNFTHPQSDFIILLNIWNSFFAQHGSFSWSRLKRFCVTNYMSFQRFREWIDLHGQLKRILIGQKKFRFNETEASYEDIHCSLLTGLFRQCALRKKGNLYQGISNNELTVFPGSQQFSRSGDWIMAGSFVETSKLFALTVATIQAEWIENSAKDFCSYSWTNVRWQKKSGRVLADERVTLQGLIVINGRIVNFAQRRKENIPEARQVFIQKGLIENPMKSSFDFLDHNSALIIEWQEKEHRLRKKNIVIDDAALFDFYDTRLPQDVYDRSTLIRYLKKDPDHDLVMKEQDIVLQDPGKNDLLNYPSSLSYHNHDILLTYCFEPGNQADGVTANIPDHLLDTIRPEIFEWLVPGLLAEKTTFLLKGLPKRIRKKLIPINITVDRLLDTMQPGHTPFLPAVSSAVFKLYNLTVNRNEWPDQLPDHLRMRFILLDTQGNESASGRSLPELLDTFQNPIGGELPTYLSTEDEQLLEVLNNRVFRTWDFDNLPNRIPVYSGKDKVIGFRYAALDPLPAEQGVKVSYHESADRAQASNIDGTHFLLQLPFKGACKQLRKYCRISLSGPSTVWLSSALGGREQAQASLLRFVMRSFFGSDFSAIIDRSLFDSLVRKGNDRNLYTHGRSLIDRSLNILRIRNETHQLIRKFELRSQPNTLNHELFADLYRHLETTLPADFLEHINESDLDDRGRHLKSLATRVERAYNNPLKDQEKRRKLSVYIEYIEQLQANISSAEENCCRSFDNFRLMVEELQISLFSPEIKTSLKISEKKVRAALQQLKAEC